MGASRRHRTTVEVEYDPDGWPLEPNDCHYPGLKLCCTQNVRICRLPPVWQVTRWERNSRLRGWYCDEHLPDEDRPGDRPRQSSAQAGS